MGNTVGNFGTRDFSVSYWFKTNDTKQTMEGVGNRNSGSGGTYAGNRLGRTVSDGGVETTVVTEIYSAGPNGVSDIIPFATRPLHDNKWHHVIYTRNSVTNPDGGTGG